MENAVAIRCRGHLLHGEGLIVTSNYLPQRAA